MTLSEILMPLQPGASDWTVHIPENWLQGRTAYGGLQGAIAIQAMRQLVPSTLPLRSLQTTFVGPVFAGPVRVEARILRQGKSTTHAECRLLIDDQILLITIGIFGVSRESAIQLTLPRADPPLPVEAAQAFPYIPTMMPAFTQNLDFRWATANLPFSGAAESRLQTYMRFQDAASVSDETRLVALADALPSPAMAPFRRPVPGSSLNWTLELLQDAPVLSADDYIYMDYLATSAQSGYVNQTATLWNPAGEAIGLSRQTFVIFG